MEPEKIKTLSRKLSKYLSKNNLSIRDMRCLGEEMGKIFAQNFEEGSEEEELDSFLFGFVNSIYLNAQRPQNMPKHKSDDDEQKD